MNRLKLNNILKNDPRLCVAARVFDIFGDVKMCTLLLETTYIVDKIAVAPEVNKSSVNHFTKIMDDTITAPIVSNENTNVVKITVGDQSVQVSAACYKQWRQMNGDIMDLARRACFYSFVDMGASTPYTNYITEEFIMAHGANMLICDMAHFTCNNLSCRSIYDGTINDMEFKSGTTAVVHLHCDFILMYYIDIVIRKFCRRGVIFYVIVAPDHALVVQLAISNPHYKSHECLSIPFMELSGARNDTPMLLVKYEHK
jgi:hypothetical protein